MIWGKKKTLRQEWMVYCPILVDGKPSCPWQIIIKLSQLSFNTTAWYFGIDQMEADCHFWRVCKSPNSVIKMRDIAKCSTLPYENIPPSGLLWVENNAHVSRDTETSCHFVAPFIFGPCISVELDALRAISNRTLHMEPSVLELNWKLWLIVLRIEKSNWITEFI